MSNDGKLLVLDTKGLWIKNDVWTLLYQHEGEEKKLPAVENITFMSKSIFYSDGLDLVKIDLNAKSKSLITMKSSHADENIIFFVKEQHNGKLVLFSGDFSMKLYDENATLGPKIWTMCGYICPYCLKSCLCPGDLKKRHLKCHYGPVACKSCKVKWSTEGTLFILIYF